MAQLPSAFKPQDHDTTQTEFELLPTGIYQLEIIGSELRDDDKGNLSVSLNYSVVEPEQYKGRRFYGWIDYQNQDIKKQEGGQRDLSRLCRACSYDRDDLADTDILHFITFTARVENSPAGVAKNGNPYKAKNRIKKFFFPDEGELPEPLVEVPANDNRPPVRQATNDNTPPRGDARTTGNGGAAATGKARPWGKRAA